jgi:hypothetical protein
MFTFVICSVFKNESHILEEWINNYLLHGVDHFYLVNDFSTDNFLSIIEKYNITFDTLILDCEGAFYYILMDMPEILNNIKLIIMENDYLNIEHKNYVDNILKLNNFKRDYCESATGGWPLCCYNNFFEVWIKNQSP